MTFTTLWLPLWFIKALKCWAFPSDWSLKYIYLHSHQCWDIHVTGRLYICYIHVWYTFLQKSIHNITACMNQSAVCISRLCVLIMTTQWQTFLIPSYPWNKCHPIYMIKLSGRITFRFKSITFSVKLHIKNLFKSCKLFHLIIYSSQNTWKGY